MSDPNLVTTYTLHGQDYLVKMNIVQNYLELALTDKQTGEEWQCSYDSSYIENLTHKTGNFKQFDIFVAMLKSGLLKTSSCISLDLLSHEDLETLRIRRLKCHTVRTLSSNRANNRRYLIITYTVEFDRIHYPLPLEYSGPPDPIILQATVKKLENQLEEVTEQLQLKSSKNDSKQIYLLQKRVEELEYENDELHGEIYQLKKVMNTRPKNQMQMMQKAINNLEKGVVSERKSHHRLVEQLRNEKLQLHRELEKRKASEKALKLKLQNLLEQQKYSSDTFRTMYRRKKSPLVRTFKTEQVTEKRSQSPKITKSEGWATDEKSMGDKKLTKTLRSRSPNSSITSAKSTDDKERSSRKATPRSRSSSAGSNLSSSSKKSKKSDLLRDLVRTSEADFKSLEERMQWLQKLLKNK